MTRVSVRDLLKDRARPRDGRARAPFSSRSRDEERICRHHRSLWRESRSAPAEPIVTQSVAWRACVQECDVNRLLLRRSVTRRRVISTRKSPLRRRGGDEKREESRILAIRRSRPASYLWSLLLVASPPITSPPQNYFVPLST